LLKPSLRVHKHGAYGNHYCQPNRAKLGILVGLYSQRVYRWRSCSIALQVPCLLLRHYDETSTSNWIDKGL